MLTLLGDIGFVGAAAGAVAFLVTYTVSTPWWRKPPGRFLWLFGAIVTVILVLATIVKFFGTLPGLPILRAVLYLALAAAIWGAVIALIRVQILKRRAIWKA